MWSVWRAGRCIFGVVLRSKKRHDQVCFFKTSFLLKMYNCKAFAFHHVQHSFEEHIGQCLHVDLPNQKLQPLLAMIMQIILEELGCKSNHVFYSLFVEIAHSQSSIRAHERYAMFQLVNFDAHAKLRIPHRAARAIDSAFSKRLRAIDSAFCEYRTDSPCGKLRRIVWLFTTGNCELLEIGKDRDGWELHPTKT